MQKKTNQFEIPAVLMHEVDGVLYRLNGTIVGINESRNTCSMQFEGYPVFNGIPMDSIYINEAFLDKVKEYGKKAWQGFKKLIKAAGGFLFPTNADGKADMEYLYNPINIGIAEMKGNILRFFPSAAVAEVAAENGVKLPHAGQHPGDASGEDDKKQIEAYWSRVMKTYVKNESMSVNDAVKYVNENYYTTVKNSLNEASTISIGNVIEGQYGMEVGTKELAMLLYTNINNQLSGTPGHHAKTKPYLIWGAPGIGKTAAVYATIELLKKMDGTNLSLQHLPCGQMYRDDYVIPATERNAVGQLVAIDVSKIWLPVYFPPVNQQKLKEVDDFYNSGKYRYRKEQLTLDDGTVEEPESFDGGIIFLDEFMRMPPQSLNIIMSVINEHVYNGMILASKWGWILASNRAFDTLEDEKATIWEPAQADRYTSVTYVPTREEWLNWARRKNSETGIQNVDEMICNFIEHSPMSVWYDALKLGSRNSEFTQDEINTLDGDDFEAIQAILKEHSSAMHKLTWTPRAWSERINDTIIGTLKGNLFKPTPELFNDCFVNGNLNMAKLAKNLDKVSDEKWEFFTDGIDDKLDPNHQLSRYAFFMKYISYVIEQVTGKGKLPVTEWNNYHNFRSTFTTQVINSIWEEGNLGDPQLIKDDDLYFNTPGQYETTEFSKWKKNSSLADEVTSLIVNGYPGGDEAITRDLKKDMKVLQNVKPITDAEYKKLFDKYAKHYSVKIGKRQVYLLYKPTEFNPSDEVDKEMQKNTLITLHNSEFARRYANVAMYIAKFSIQMHTDTKLGDMVNELLCGWFYQHVTDKELKAQIVPLSAMSGIDGSEEQILTSKMIGFPATVILNNTMYMDKEFAVNGSY